MRADTKKTAVWPWSEALTRHLERRPIDDSRGQVLELRGLASLYELVCEHDALVEPGVLRSPEASFNPRPARVCQILLQARPLIPIQLLGAAFLHCCPVGVLRNWLEEAWSGTGELDMGASLRSASGQFSGRVRVLEYFRDALLVAVHADWIVGQCHEGQHVELLWHQVVPLAADAISEFWRRSSEAILVDSLQVALAKHLDTVRHLHLAATPITSQVAEDRTFVDDEPQEILNRVDKERVVSDGWALITFLKEIRRDSSRSPRGVDRDVKGAEMWQQSQATQRLGTLLESALSRYLRRMPSGAEFC